MALKSDGTVVAWGGNDNGQTAVPADLIGVTAIAAGDQHTVALKSNGTVVAWGGNGNGQTVVPGGLSGVTAIAAGGYHTVALKSDGTVVAWGLDSQNQMTVPGGLSGVTAIAAGNVHTVALVNGVPLLTFSTDFSSQPPNTRLFGTDINAGVIEDGVLKLTKGPGGKQGAFIIDDLDNGAPIRAFTVTFDLFIGGGTVADGLSFNFASDLPNSSFSEEGAGTGLTVSFDTYDNGFGEAPAIDVKWNGTVLTSTKNVLSLFRADRFVPVRINVDSDGTLDLSVDGTSVQANLPGAFSPIAGRFGFSARTGAAWDNQFVDNLTITTLPIMVTAPAIVNHAPAGADKTVTTRVNSPYAFAAADFGFSDPNDNPANSFSRLKITTLPAAGALTVNGIPVTAGSSVTWAPAPAGATWTSQAGSGVRDWTDLACSADGTKLVAGTWGGSLYASTDAGVTWTARLTDANRAANGLASSADGLKLVAAMRYDNLFTSTDSGATWTARDSKRFWTSVASSTDGAKLIAADGNPGYLYTSADSGVTWTERTSAGSRPWAGVASSADGSKLVAVVAGGGQVYTSIDSGVTWATRGSVQNWRAVASSADGAKLAAAVEGGQIYTSTDSGAIWTARESSRMWKGLRSSANGNVLLAGEAGGKLYVSTDSGVTWTARDSNRPWRGFAISSDGARMAVGWGGIPGAGGTIYTSVGTLATPLVFAPGANGVGAPYTSFTFQVQDDGGTENSGVDLDPTPRTMTVNVTSPNEAPSFVKGMDEYLLEDFGPRVAVNWATSIQPGPAWESSQGVTFLVSNNNATLFATPPALSPTGTLTYTIAPNKSGTATVTVRLQDNGGTSEGGVDTSAEQTFAITVLPMNDPPSFTLASSLVTASEDSLFRQDNFAASIQPGPSDEASQKVTFQVAAANPTFFKVQPTIDSRGTLSFTPAGDAIGYGMVTVFLRDDGKETLGGLDRSVVQLFLVRVDAKNDPPSFRLSSTIKLVAEDSPAQTAPNFATLIVAGPPNESWQSLTFLLTNSAPGLFTSAGQPKISRQGTLTFTPAPDAFGSAKLTAVLRDNGGTANGGVDTSVLASFTLTLLPVNDAPSFQLSTNVVSVVEDSLAQNRIKFVSTIRTGPTNESNQTVTFSVTATNLGLFLKPPAISPAGDLSFTPKPNVSGSSVVRVGMIDNGGTALGGTNAAPPQSFTITITPQNDAPIIVVPKTVTVTEDGATNVVIVMTDLDSPMTNVLATALSSNTNLVASAGLIISGVGTNRVVTVRPLTNAVGDTTIRLAANDQEGGLATNVFTLKVQAVNDAPGFTLRTNRIVVTNAVTATISNFATNLTRGGGSDEASQTLTFVMTNSSSSFFAKAPAIGADGTLTFQPSPSAGGTNTVTVRVKDNGGTALGGVDQSSAQTFTIVAVLPVTITRQPQSQSAVIPSAVALSVQATGSAPLSYRWRKDGVDIPGATSSSFVITAALADDAGSYTVVVSNAAGSVTSSSATLTVTAPSGFNPSPVLLLSDNFTATGAVAVNGFWSNLDVNLAGRQTGLLAPVTYTRSGNAQLGNASIVHDGGNALLCAGGANAALNVNFNGANSVGGLRLSVDFDPNSINDPFYAGPGAWAAIVLGGSSAQRNAGVLDSGPRLALLFRKEGKLAVIDSGTEVTTSATEANWAATNDYSGFLNGYRMRHLDIICSGPGDGNPFDGSGATKVEVYVDGGATPVYSYTNAVGYADNYINLQGFAVATFDNLMITKYAVVSAPNTAPTFVGSATTLVAQQGASVEVKSLLHVSDTDGFQTLTWSQSVAPTNGTLSFSSAKVMSGGTDLAPAGTVSYLPQAGYFGADSFTIQVSDGTASATRAIQVNVVAKNFAPLGANNTVTASRDSFYAFTPPDFGFSDPSNSVPNKFYRLKVTTLPAAGALTSGGNPVQAGAFIPITASAAGETWTSQTGSGVRDWTDVAGSADGTKLVAGTWGDYLYTSTDSGVTWTARLTDATRAANSLASSADGTKLVAAMRDDYLFTSTDSGVTWTARDSQRFWTAVASSADGTKLIAANGFPGMLYTSADSGVTWTERTSSGSRPWAGVASSADGSKLVAAVAGTGQIYTSTDSGATWTARESARNWRSVASSADGTKLAAAVENGQIYTSTDSGATWTARESSRSWKGIRSSADGSVLLAGEAGGKLYVSKDSGVTWTPKDNNRLWRGFAISSDGSRMAAGLGGGANAGTVYTSVGSPAASLVFTPAASAYGTPYASFTFQVQDDGGTANGGVDLDPTPRTMTLNVQGLHAPVGANKTVTTTSSTPYSFAAADFGFSDPTDSPPDKFYRLKVTTLPAAGTLTVSGSAVNAGDFVAMTPGPAGTTWTSQTGSGVRGWTTVACSADGAKLVAGTWGNYLYTSSDSGVTWTARLTDMARSFYSVASSADGTKLIAGTRYDSLFTSTDSGVTWTARESQRYWRAVASSTDGTKLVAADGNPGKIYTSTDSGVTWTERTSAGHREWKGVASSSDGTKLVAVSGAPWGSTGSRIYTSTDSGATWTARTQSDLDWSGVASSADGTKLVAQVYNGQLYNSTDSGATWTAREGVREWYGIASSADGTLALACDKAGYLYVSSDAGVTWTSRQTDANRPWRACAVSADGRLMAAVFSWTGVEGTIYRSVGASAAPLVFTPVTGAQGSPYASFTFQVQDDGGARNGGADLDGLPRTMAVNVIAVIPPSTQQAKLTGDDVAAANNALLSGVRYNSRYAGWSALSGDTAVVGAVGQANFRGAAYVFVRSGTTWSQQQKLTASDGAGGDEFGALAVDGDTILVGANGAPLNATGFAGAVYVFVRSGTTWTQQAKLTASDIAANARFGVSVALSGDRAVIGATGAIVGGFADAGAVYVFERTGATWTQKAKLTASDAAASARFGLSVALSGGTIVAGALDADTDGLTDNGAAYVFVGSGTTWTQQAKLTASDKQGNDEFGHRVALSGDTALVGSRNAGASSQGIVYAFVRSGTTWSQQARLQGSSGSAPGQFGHSMALSGDMALIGSAASDFARGQVYVFTRSGTTWTEQSIVKPSDLQLGDGFGASVAMSGGTALVGSPKTGTSANPGVSEPPGAAYVFVQSGGVPNMPAEMLVATPRDSDRVSLIGTHAPLQSGLVAGTPGLLRLLRHAGKFHIAVPTVDGLTYRLEYKDSLTESEWKPITSIRGDGNEREMVDLDARGLIRFYRIRVNEE